VRAAERRRPCRSPRGAAMHAEGRNAPIARPGATGPAMGAGRSWPARRRLNAPGGSSGATAPRHCPHCRASCGARLAATSLSMTRLRTRGTRFHTAKRRPCGRRLSRHERELGTRFWRQRVEPERGPGYWARTRGSSRRGHEPHDGLDLPFVSLHPRPGARWRAPAARAGRVGGWTRGDAGAVPRMWMGAGLVSIGYQSRRG
jgi:hypothetical protein